MSRDINRIEPFLKRLEIVWKKHPDWRFGQLLENTLIYTGDPFYIEDEEMIQIFEKLF